MHLLSIVLKVWSAGFIGFSYSVINLSYFHSKPPDYILISGTWQMNTFTALLIYLQV